MSDEGMEGMERAEDRAEDVEGHGFDQVDGMEQVDAKDEPADVEAHSFDQVDAMEARPID
jgi:hypothetical protein